jgi:Predicted glycosyltransferases
MRQFKVLIIIVAYNAAKWLDRCVGGFAVMPSGWQVLVVDNNSKDNTVNIVKEKYPFVRLIEKKENLGFGRANNIGMEIALKENFDFAFLLNQDASISVDGIQKLAELQSDNAQYYIVSPLHYNGSGSSFDYNLSDYVNKNNSPILLDVGKNSYKNLYEIKGINAAAWLLSRKCLSEIGGFSPSFFHYGEDDNYTDRILYHGGKIAMSPLAAVYHDREKRVRKNKNEIIIKRIYDMSRPEKKIKADAILKYIVACLLSFNFKALALLRKTLEYKKLSMKPGHTFLNID